jgi:hypothetical protein
MARFGSIAALPRTAVADIPSALSVKVVPDGVSPGNREVYRWAVDSYGTVTVGVFLPVGKTLPKGGITLTPEDFDPSDGTDKARRGRSVGAYHDRTVTTGEGKTKRHLSIFVEAPSDYDFESVTIRHA